MRRARLIAALGFALVAISAPAHANAAAGALDPTFGSGGTEQLFAGEPKLSTAGMTVQADGKILIAGSRNEGIFVARLLENGALDPSFGTGGEVVTPVAGSYAGAEAVAEQADGRIVVAGGAESAFGTDPIVARYQPNGTPDTTFGGGDGIETIPVGPEPDDLRAIAFGAGGRILLTGEAGNPKGSTLAVVVLSANGTPDPAFSGDGIRTLETKGGENSESGEAIAEDSLGTILVADSVDVGGGNGFTLVRLTPGGEPDPTFDGDGVATVPIPGASGGSVEDLALLPDGRILASGYGFDQIGAATDQKVAAIRLLPNGALDPTFGADGTGIFTDQIAPGEESADAIAVTPHGKVVLGGSYEAGGLRSLVVLRLTADGALDPTFGSGGLSARPATAPFEEFFDDGVLDPAERYVVLSRTYEGSKLASTGVTRYLLADSPPTPALVGPPTPTPRAPASAPVARLKKLPGKIAAAKLKGFSGTAADADGGSVAKVQIALELLPARTPKKAQASKTGAKKICLALANPRIRFKSSRVKKGVACPQRWLDATGTTSWTYKLKKTLPPGRYVVYARALAADGSTESTFSETAGDRAAFRVVP